MHGDKVDLKKLAENIPYNYYPSAPSFEKCFQPIHLNCSDEPDDVYNNIFKHLETTTFRHRQEVQRELENIYKNHFAFLSYEEFITFIHKKYQIVQENQDIRVKKRRVI